MGSFSYLATLLRLNVKSGLRPFLPSAIAATLMCANNLVFFIIWLIYFQRFSSLKGWGLEDVALLFGIAAWSFGLTVLVAGGVRDITRSIVDGSLDVHLGRPRHPLPSLIFGRSIAAGFGDLASAVVLWLGYAGKDLLDLPFILLVASAAAVIVVATATLVSLTVFWLPNTVQLVEDVYFMLLMAAVYPQHVFGPFLRLLLFTLLPAAFIGLVPVETIRETSLEKLAVLLGAALVYASLAVLVFERGLKRYTSGSSLSAP
ncbi:MAG: ABC-2 family transporter protein [Proteobacteria bacterium]|nr:ABC-2 family transporter protein [Pseudomonadota bacterium]